MIQQRMIPQQWQRVPPTSWFRRGLTPKRRAEHRRRPVIEPMEARQLLATVAEFPVPTANSNPIGIVAGSDGNLWFTEILGNKIGMINPTTHAATDFAVPTANANPYGIAAGPDGNLWFTENAANKIGTINPATHVITEFALPTAGANPETIAAGPDGNLWFTEQGANKIGMVNPTTHAIAEFPVPTANAFVFGITAGADGNVWFTEVLGNKIGTINPTTHTIAEFPIPTAASSTYGITAGPDGKIWFAEHDGNKIGQIDPTTHTIVETNLPTAGSSPFGITAGPDGNLWFAERAGNRIGSINPITRGITETAIPTVSSATRMIAPGPDGNLWFAETGGQKLGVLTPSLNLIVTGQPPAFVAPNAPFNLTVTVNYQSGGLYAGYNGNVTLALLSTNPGATLGGTLTAAAKNGVATFSGLTLNQLGSGARIMASTDPLTTTLTTPVTVATPPMIVTQRVLYVGRGRRRRVVGFALDFSAALDPARATNLANYALTQLQRRGGRLTALAVTFRVAYDPTTHEVTLTLLGKPRFAAGGKLVVAARPPTGLTNATGAPLDGGNLGTFGTDATFLIARNGKGIRR